MYIDDPERPHTGRTDAQLVELAVEAKLAHQHRRCRDLQQSRAECSPVQLPPVKVPPVGGLRELFEAAAAEVCDANCRIISRCPGFQFLLLTRHFITRSPASETRSMQLFDVLPISTWDNSSGNKLLMKSRVPSKDRTEFLGRLFPGILVERRTILNLRRVSKKAIRKNKRSEDD